MAHKNQSNWSPYKAKSGNSKTPSAKQSAANRPGPSRGRRSQPEKIFSQEEASDRLRDYFANHGFAELPHDKRAQFAHFYRLLMENQSKANLTRLLRLRDVAIKHFVDCMMVARITRLQFPLMDLGSGPGFPGIPLKILFPEERILLAEGVQKRVEFLKQVREQMDLPKLDIIGRNIDPEFALPVQGVITRAVEDTRNTLRNVLGCLRVGGKVYFMKGPQADPELVLAKEWSEFYRLHEDIHYSLPESPHQRRLLVYEKIKTPEDPLQYLQDSSQKERP